jgi:hypothetical protein
MPLQNSIFQIMKAKGIYFGKPRDFRTVYFTRLERIKKEGSPYYTWPVPVTAPAAISAIDLNTYFPLSRKYAPLDWLEIVNNDVVDLTLILNGQGGEYLNVPAATTRPVIGKALWKIAVRNDDAAADSVLNQIMVTVRRQPKTIDMVAREL